MHDKDKLVKTYTLDTLCPFPFDKSIDMPPFPRGVELPKYDKYFGTTNPQDHLQEFGSLSIYALSDISHASIPKKSRWPGYGVVVTLAYWYQHI